jgi:hypothetical protein
MGRTVIFPGSTAAVKREFRPVTRICTVLSVPAGLGLRAPKTGWRAGEAWLNKGPTTL